MTATIWDEYDKKLREGDYEEGMTIWDLMALDFAEEFAEAQGDLRAIGAVMRKYGLTWRQM